MFIQQNNNYSFLLDVSYFQIKQVSTSASNRTSIDFYGLCISLASCVQILNCTSLVVLLFNVYKHLENAVLLIKDEISRDNTCLFYCNDLSVTSDTLLDLHAGDNTASA